ncbi:glycosyltransferase family 1 protein [bacterium]|nr:glycosyltransferase family 1 protein [bacterium]
MKHVAIIGSAGIPAKYGGYETFVENMVEHLSEKLELTVYCTDKIYPERRSSYKGATLKYVPLSANGWQSILYDGISLARAAFNADVCLVLGVSGAIFFPVFRLISRTKIVCNTDGIEWKRAKWSGLAKAILKLSEWLAVHNAHTVISDNLVIKEFIADHYGRSSIFIPYGGDHIVVKDFDDTLFNEFGIERESYFLNISRIEPENNSQTILEAFSRVPNEKLVMIGNWEDSAYGRYLFDTYHQRPNIRMLDAMFDRQDEKNCIRANCKAYVHGHSVGGTSPALVEALTLERIPVCFDVSFNRSTCNGLGFYFQAVDDLVKIIKSFDETVDLTVLKIDMRELCKRRYSWEVVSKQYLNVFCT